MHWNELPCLYISGFHLLLWPGYYTIRVSDDGQGIGVAGLDLLLTIQLTFRTCITLCRCWALSDFLGPFHDSHRPMGSEAICSCPEHRLCCLLPAVIILHLCYHSVTLVQPEWHVYVIAVDPSDVDQWVSQCLVLHIKMDDVHLEGVADFLLWSGWGG